jgi:transcription-repair coupling factor (superfamily II helicase)
VGYELYCRLLENAVCGLKNLPPKDPPPVRIDLPGDAWIPRDYIADLRSKIDFYRRISRAAAQSHVDDLETEIEDRFGPLPMAFHRLLDLARLRIIASSLSIDSISKQPGLLVVGHHDIHRVEKWRQHCLLSGQEVRVVGNKTVVLPLHERVASDEEILFQTVKKLFQIE